MANVNGFDPGPYAVDGSRLRAATLRAALAASTSKAEGIVSPADCKVHQLPVPGAGVAIDRGTVLVRNRSGSVRDETYAARGALDSTVDGPASSPQARSHLVVLRIKDPEFSPWVLPAGTDAATYQYPEPIIIQNVPAGTTSAAQLNLGYSAVALARLDIPANATTITDSMIKDLRKVALPRRERFVTSWRQPSGTSEWWSHEWNGAPRHYPAAMSIPVACPEWATQVKMIVNVGNMLEFGGAFTGGMRAEYGWGGQTQVIAGFTEMSGLHNENEASRPTERNTIVIAGELYLPADYRGKTHNVRLAAEINPGAEGTIAVDEWTTVTVDLEFVEVAE